jgi:DNA polymerase-4
MNNETLGIVTGLRWLVLDLNSFFASCEQQDNRELRGRPVAVVPGTNPMSTCAIAASYEAKAFGIKTGTLIREAVIACPDLVLVQADHRKYVEYHHRVRNAIESCIPIEKVMSIDEVACRLDRLQCARDAARGLALAIKQKIHDDVGMCLTSSIGIASNKFLAKMASNMEKPNGLTLLLPEDLPQKILALDLRAIPGVGRNMETRLHDAGINDMAALWAATPDHLRRIWGGINGVKFHALLHGIDLANRDNPRRSIGHSKVLAPEERSKQNATPIIRRLLVKAGQRLRADNLYCRRLTLDAKWERHQGHWALEQDFMETQDTGLLLRVLNQLWDEMPNQRPLRVGITLSGLVEATAHQPDLFDKPVAEGVLSHALDRLNRKFGANTVVYGQVMQPLESKIAFQRVPDLAEYSR